MCGYERGVRIAYHCIMYYTMYTSMCVQYIQPHKPMSSHPQHTCCAWYPPHQHTPTDMPRCNSIPPHPWQPCSTGDGPRNCQGRYAGRCCTTYMLLTPVCVHGVCFFVLVFYEHKARCTAIICCHHTKPTHSTESSTLPAPHVHSQPLHTHAPPGCCAHQDPARPLSTATAQQ